MPALYWMGWSSSALGEDPLQKIGTSSMWFALEGSKLQLENKRGEHVTVGPWDEIVLSLVGMIRILPTS